MIKTVTAAFAVASLVLLGAVGVVAAAAQPAERPSVLATEKCC